jgi:hypothetical protein
MPSQLRREVVAVPDAAVASPTASSAAALVGVATMIASSLCKKPVGRTEVFRSTSVFLYFNG